MFLLKKVPQVFSSLFQYLEMHSGIQNFREIDFTKIFVKKYYGVRNRDRHLIQVDFHSALQ